MKLDIGKIYNSINNCLQHLFKPLPILLALTVSTIEIVNFLTPDPFEKVASQIMQYQREICLLTPIVIPDSLCNDFINETHLLQQKIITYAKVINSCVAVETDNAPTIKFQLERVEMAVLASQSAEDMLRRYLKRWGNERVIANKGMSLFQPELGALIEKKDILNRYLKKYAIEIERIHESDETDVVMNIQASNEFKDWLKASNDFVTSTFEFLNIVKLSTAYSVRFENLK